MQLRKQQEVIEYAEGKLSAQIRRAEELVKDLDSAVRRRPREDGGWSVDENLAHLARVNETYLGQLRPLVEQSAPASNASSTDWKPTLLGRMLRWAVTTPKSLKTAGIFNPAELDIDGDPLDAYVNTQESVLNTLDALRDRQWRSLRCASPVSSIVRMNVGDIFVMLADHGDRHLNQIAHLRDTFAASHA